MSTQWLHRVHQFRASRLDRVDRSPCVTCGAARRRASRWHSTIDGSRDNRTRRAETGLPQGRNPPSPPGSAPSIAICAVEFFELLLSRPFFTSNSHMTTIIRSESSPKVRRRHLDSGSLKLKSLSCKQSGDHLDHTLRRWRLSPAKHRPGPRRIGAPLVRRRTPAACRPIIGELPAVSTWLPGGTESVPSAAAAHQSPSTQLTIVNSSSQLTAPKCPNSVWRAAITAAPRLSSFAVRSCPACFRGLCPRPIYHPKGGFLERRLIEAKSTTALTMRRNS